MNILIFRTNSELNTSAAGIITSLLQTNPAAVLGLATGSTPVGIYKELVSSYRKGLVSFRQATTFNLDEYVGLADDHPESYHAYMRDHLFQHIDLPEKNAHIPNGNAPDLAQECQRYNQLIRQAKQIDLQILGLGHNGHIGFNEPDHALNSETHVVDLEDATREANARFFPSIAEVPKQALTMGVGTILKAKTILFVVQGTDKAKIVHRALTGPISTECPASLLQTHPNLVVMLDKDAGKLLHDHSQNPLLPL